MKKNTSLALALALQLSLFAPLLLHAQQQQPAPSAAQKPSSSPSPAQTDDKDEVVRITANLVQVDAVVTKNGKGVTDLTAEDFEIYEDGRPQAITNFSYISLDARRATGTIASAVARKGRTEAATGGAPPVVPAAPLRPEQVERTIALVIDDLGLSFESMANVREAMKKFVDEQMQPGDLVAILRTSAGLGSLQQFTSDKRILNAAIERVRWYPLGRGGISAFAPVVPDVTAEAVAAGEEFKRRSGVGSPLPDTTSANGLRDIGDEIDVYREEIFSVGTLGALNFVVKGLRELPGRKSAILFSDGISILRRDGKSKNVLESMRRLVDLANRASVVVYTMDARGLQSLAANAQDNFGRRTAAQINNATDERSASYFESKNGLNYLAEQTGGFLIENDNDLSAGVRAVLDDQKGYYLLGYRPNESTFDAKTGGRRKFYQLDVRVKRPGLKVRTRNGFYAVAETEAHAKRTTRQEQLYGAVGSPFAAGGVHLRLTSLYANDPGAGAVMRSLLYVDPADLTFKEDRDGTRRVALDVLALTFGESGEPLDDYNAALEWSGNESAYRHILRSGLVYFVNVPVKRPGPYQLRLAVRDAATERTGSASQFIEVPDLEKGRLTLSGLILSGNDLEATTIPASDAKPPAAASSPDANANGRVPAPSSSNADPQSGPALRRLRPGMELFYNFAVYNARLDRAAGARPQLSMQVRLFRDGREIYTGKLLPVDIGQQPDMKNLLAGGRLKLSRTFPPGNYILQVVVNDALAKEKQRTATQWIDFEIVKL